MKKTILLSLVLISMSLIYQSCEKSLFCIEGEGNIVTEELDVNAFHSINSIGAIDVVIRQGEVQRVEAEGHQNILDYLQTKVEDKHWDIELDDDHCFRDYELTVYITVPDMQSVSITGSADVVMEDFSGQHQLDINITGSGDVVLNDLLGCNTMNVDVSGSGDVECKGSYDSLEMLDIRITGTGSFDGFKAETENCEIKISGFGDCNVHVLNSLDVDISGSGSIYYKGSPEVSSQISGTGNIVKVN